MLSSLEWRVGIRYFGFKVLLDKDLWMKVIFSGGMYRPSRKVVPVPVSLSNKF